MIPSYLPHNVLTVTCYAVTRTEEHKRLWQNETKLQHISVGGMEP